MQALSLCENTSAQIQLEVGSIAVQIQEVMSSYFSSDIRF